MRIVFLVLSLIGVSFAMAAHKFHHPGEFLKAVAVAKKPGKKTYIEFCANCHAIEPLINLGAPRAGVAKDWVVRLNQPSERLIKHVFEGHGAMPARGGCFECSDDVLISAINYMLPASKKLAR